MTGTKISNDDDGCDGCDGAFIPATGSCLVTVNDGFYLCMNLLTFQIKMKTMK